MRYLVAVLFALVLPSVSAQSHEVQFRSPRSFSELPPNFATSLAGEGCRVPRATFEGKFFASNVLSGSFAKKGQLDWAVLCSDNGHEYIRVYWGGHATCPSRIDKGESMSEEEIKQGREFDRAIEKVDRRFIMENYGDFGGPKPPEITHLGISYAFLGKGSLVHYCYNGEWLALTGED